MDSGTDKISELDKYVNQLQDEMKTVDAFKHELPLSMMLLNDAITILNAEKMRCQKEPILKEFIPLKKSSPGDKDEKIGETDIVDRREKMSWMSLVQLWNSGSNEKREEESVDRAAVESSRAAGTSDLTVGKEGRDDFQWLSLGIKNSMEDDFSAKSGSNTQTAEIVRKQRRCWSPELHGRFLGALEQLGGAQAATPKQIREIMQADGRLTITKDEVKSHLQNYRLRNKDDDGGGEPH
ncbi:transcription factor NIGTH1-like [Salvia splendens]|uniref:transcription factor NIGTH1-like n=1 Tax=Salvia splendens TaxID=180675 RepID=UPI001C27E703|nr:transcription factor NIGTH1-like [Salvia splendens]